MVFPAYAAALLRVGAAVAPVFVSPEYPLRTGALVGDGAAGRCGSQAGRAASWRAYGEEPTSLDCRPGRGLAPFLVDVRAAR